MGTSVAVDALDTGVIAIDKEYHIWVISKEDGTTKCVASLQSTANATFLSNLSAIASGAYTYYARCGAVMTIHGSATLYGTWQLGRIAQYVVGLAQTSVVPNIANGVAGTYSSTSPTLASVTVAGNGKWVPSTASRININAITHWKNGALSNVLVAPSTAWGGSNMGPLGSAGQVYPYFGDGTINASASFWMLLESSAIGWAADSTGGAISCMGWEDNI
jgi:hypothetical protein